MTSRIFSINLDDLTFAKLGELQKKYPEMSRNAMIRHIIHTVHLLESPRDLESREKQRVRLMQFVHMNEERIEKWFNFCKRNKNE